MENLFSAEFPPELVEEIQGYILQVKNLMPAGLVNLTPEERQYFIKMGDKTIAFVMKVIDFSNIYPVFIPSYVSLINLKSDMDSIAAMQTILRDMEGVTSKLKDSILLAGSEAFTAALSIYNSVKDAAHRDVPNAKVVYDELKVRFPGRKKKDVPPVA